MPKIGYVSAPVLVAVGFVVASAVLVTLWQSRKKSKKIVTLKDPLVNVPLPLIEKRILSHDTRLFRFGLPSSEHVLGLPIGHHVKLTAKINGENVSRPYTPVSSDEDKGHMDLVVKVYFKDTHPKFPAGGKMTQHLESLKIGDTIDVRGPIGRLTYRGRGTLSLRLLRNDPNRIVTVKKIAMIAGGTGIAPMLQLIRAIQRDPKDKTEVSLLFANQTERDILLRDELEEAVAKSQGRFKLWYTVDTAGDDWKYSTGFVSADMVQEHLFPLSEDSFVFMCGPPPMIDFACHPILDKLSHDKQRRFVF